MVTVWVGMDTSALGHCLANSVCVRSIRKHNPNVMIHGLHRDQLRKDGVFLREEDTGSTEFTYTRFLVPHLCGYKGIAIFCDNDFLWRADIERLVRDHFDRTKAVMCVKHEYTSCPSATKMDGQKQEWYPRKNWSSLMMFNCEHPSIRNLTPEAVATKSPAWLHRLQWCSDDEVGELPLIYNHLVGYYSDPDPAAVHFTDGGPWFAGYQDAEFADEWNAYLTPQEKAELGRHLRSASESPPEN